MPWSHTSISKREVERISSICVNGQVKTYIKFRILDGFNSTDGVLPAIIARAARKCVKVRELDTEDGALPKFSYEILCDPFCNQENCQLTENNTSINNFLNDCEQDTNLVRTVPIVFNYLWNRLKLLERHYIRREYSDYDINLNLDQRKWAADGAGFLYSEEYDLVNRAVASGKATEEDCAEEVLKYPAIYPTVSLDPQYLMEIHKLSEARAQEVVELAQKHQVSSSTSKPPSLLTMWTERGVQASKEEEMLRKKVIQLAGELPEDTSFILSTLQIAQQLSKDLKTVSVLDGKLEQIKNRTVQLFERVSDKDQQCLGLYHLLLWKTAGEDEWTHLRGRREMRVVPYLPKLLELTRMKMEARTVLRGGRMLLRSQPKAPLDPSLASLVEDTECWKEVSILEFMNSVSPQKVRE